MHAAVIHLRLSVTPSAAVAQVVLRLIYFRLSSESWRRAVFYARLSTFLHPSSRLQSFKSPASTLHFHAGQSPSILIMKAGCFFKMSVSTRLGGITGYMTTIWQINAGKHEKCPITHLPLKIDYLENGSLDCCVSIVTKLEAWWKRNLGLIISIDYLCHDVLTGFVFYRASYSVCAEINFPENKAVGT